MLGSPIAPPHDLSPDVTILGGGIMGLTLALELHARGASVRVLERGNALAQASTAAAGMLAAHDPHNPPALLPLAERSLSLYPQLLERIAHLSGIAVPFQTQTTIQHLDGDGTIRLAEHSLDPRQLAAALLAAVRATGIDLREQYISSHDERTATGHLVHASGAWATWPGHTPTVSPHKGQMLRVALPPALRALDKVHRSEHVYIVPRTQGPQAGTALIGATVEDAGFDITTSAAALYRLRLLAAGLLPALADEATAPQLEAWAGLRPATPDQLPLLGQLQPHRFIATGHYRNGILLAPATAEALADLIEAKPSRIDLKPFSPQRFEKK